MKTIIAVVTMVVLMSSCNSTKLFTDSTQKFLKDHNVQAEVKPNPETGTTKFRASIDSLYGIEKIQAIAPQADILFRAAHGKLILEGEAVGILDSDKIAELYVAVIKAISFWKK